MTYGAILTEFLVSASPRSVGRKKKWAEDMTARFAEGTFAKIAEVLMPHEDRTDFVRNAVQKEISRRERNRRKRSEVGKPSKD